MQHEAAEQLRWDYCLAEANLRSNSMMEALPALQSMGVSMECMLACMKRDEELLPGKSAAEVQAHIEDVLELMDGVEPGEPSLQAARDRAHRERTLNAAHVYKIAVLRHLLAVFNTDPCRLAIDPYDVHSWTDVYISCLIRSRPEH